eukprot:TRINITY_DN1216_c0_g1_i1.p3 TRINITY_DN1216_c0_g1~~TRINITY_DN1216_c0_g1_i1.p3  ORF type:complete len:594 (-),score=126.67 TRINITY_DN1216_c0_g1_i1:2452-4233(-)
MFDRLKEWFHDLDSKKKFVVIMVPFIVLLVFTLIVIKAASGPRNNGQDNLPDPSHRCVLVTAEHGVVATDNANCSVVGRDILVQGGNAVDAAIASALCLGVLQNFASGIGGGGIMVIRLANGTLDSFDFREWAPALSNSTMFLNNPNASLYGGLSIAVPGELAGLEMVHKIYGKLPWNQLFAPAIAYANEAYVATTLANTLRTYKSDIMTWANDHFKSVYAPNGDVLQEGDIFRQPALAKTLQNVADNGAQAFYKGTIAKNMAAEVKAAGGILSESDLSSYYRKGPLRQQPLTNWYQGYKIVGAQPPISGGICSQFALNIVEGYNFATEGFTGLNMHWLIESWKYSYSDRRALGDPAFWNITNVMAGMSSKDHAAELRNNLSPYTTYNVSHYIDLSDDDEPTRDGGTSHLAVVDVWGNAVSFTSTVNGAFGSYLTTSDGILLNNQMDDFSTPNITNKYNLPPSVANYIEPGKRPLSSMTPTIVEKDDDLYMVVGGSGGSRIITGTMQVIIGVLDFERNIADAIAFPRIHNQLIPEETIAEKDYPVDVINELLQRNHTIVFRDPLSVVQGIVIGKDGLLYAASDWRKRGLPAGY